MVDRGIAPIIPARSNSTIATHQDRALAAPVPPPVVRYERSAEIYTALIHMACARIVLKRVLG